MGAKTLVSLEEYLRTSFDDYDREYVDGEIVERTLPTYKHGKIQRRLCAIFDRLGENLPLYAASEVRNVVNSRRVRIPDVAVYAGKEPTERFPSNPPLVAIEILSLDDRPDKLLEKLEDYRKWGIPHIWVVDPEQRELSVYGDGARVKTDGYEIPEYNVTIPASEIFR